MEIIYEWGDYSTSGDDMVVLMAERLKASRPDLNVQLEVTAEHVLGKLRGTRRYREEAERYSQKLMKTKMCLVPRGSFLYTPKLFEALRYGCIAICDRLPARWFYDGAPVVQVDAWDDLERVEELFCDPARVQKLHRAALDYWRTSCFEAVPGRFIAKQLTALSRAAGSRRTMAPETSCELRSDCRWLDG